MSVFGTAQPKPGTGTELAEEARQAASGVRASALGRGDKAWSDANGVAKGLEKLADDLQSTDR